MKKWLHKPIVEWNFWDVLWAFLLLGGWGILRDVFNNLTMLAVQKAIAG